MNSSFIPIVAFLLLLTLMPSALRSQTPTFWTSKDGKTLDAQFVRLEGESVVVLKNGMELTLPFARLSQESVNHARSLARTVAPTTPTAGITFAGMVLDPSWLPDRLGVDQLFMGKPALLQPAGGGVTRSAARRRPQTSSMATSAG